MDQRHLNSCAVQRATTVKAARTQREWSRCVKAYRREMSAAPARAVLDLLAALSHQTDFSVGCYCADESRCHRSVLRELILERDARIG
jgi:uncharacterized protein YeaO (DUF488 family)